MKRLIFLLCAAGCTSASTVTASSSLTTAQTACLTSAVPGDGLDDRAAIQAACDAQHCAYLPAGVYDVDTIPVTPPARRQIPQIIANACTIYGDGQVATTLHFRGSASGQDWEGIRMTGVAPTVHSLSIQTGDVTEKLEQTHALKVLGPSAGPTVHHVTIDHPIPLTGKSGDCLQVVAYNDGRLVSGVRIRDNEFAHCDRSGVAIHSGTTDVEITDNHFPDTGNTGLDFEGTGDTSDVLIANNRFELSPGPHGQQEIQLQLISNVRVTGNVLAGRSIDVYQSDDVRIDHNTVTLTQASSAGVISVTKDSSRVSVDHNTLTRAASAGTGAIVRAVPHNTGTPDHLTVDGNVLTQATNGHVVDTIGVVGLYVTHNVVTYTGAANVGYGVLANGSGSNAVPDIRTTEIEVRDNAWTGPLHAVLGLSGSYGGSGTAASSGNVTSGAIGGIMCSNFSTGRGVSGPVTSTRDLMPIPACGPAGWITVE